jgi:hypothetical protein
MSTEKYCLIGDLHGRVEALERILQKSEGYHYVILGDAIHHKSFFRRAKRTSPVRMLLIIKELVDAGKATFIIGNNENYILSNLILPKVQIRQKEVKYTLECLKELPLEERLSLLHWLATSPLTLELESYGKTYRCAHAYYNPNYTDANRNTVLTGIGYPWFKNDRLEDHIKPDAEYFFGHYGFPYSRKNLHIIDATNFEGVGVYYTDREEFLIHY